jgi:hypothetical protein
MLDYVVKIAVIGLVKRRDASVIYQILAEMKIVPGIVGGNLTGPERTG